MGGWVADGSSTVGWAWKWSLCGYSCNKYIASSSFRQLGQAALASGNLSNKDVPSQRWREGPVVRSTGRCHHALWLAVEPMWGFGPDEVEATMLCLSPSLPPSHVTTCHSQESAGVTWKAVMLVAVMSTWIVFTHAIKITRSHLHPVAIPRSSHWGWCCHRAWSLGC